MPGYIITGKLGAGKTLCAVGRIQEVLKEGRPVATNLDLNLTVLLGKKKKNTKVFRVPDQPKLSDIKALGRAYEGPYDESKTGAIVLDECGTWLNSRDWQQKGRRELLDYLLHIRKMGWDLYFIIQDIALIDKQFRKALAEHVVYCRRMDRVNVPFLSFITKLILGKPLTFPKVHVGIVKYGDLPTSLTVDRWVYRGQDLYRAYDTTQIFKEDNYSAVYSLLPSYYLHRNSLSVKNLRFYMRLTKIYFKRFSKPAMFLAGASFLMLVTIIDRHYFDSQIMDADIAVISKAEAVETKIKKDDLWISLSDLKIVSHYNMGKNRDLYYFEDQDGLTYSVRDLSIRGIEVDGRGSCKAKLSNGTLSTEVYCSLNVSADSDDKKLVDGFDLF